MPASVQYVKYNIYFLLLLFWRGVGAESYYYSWGWPWIHDPFSSPPECGLVFFYLFVLIFETGSCLKLRPILPPQPLEGRNYRHVPDRNGFLNEFLLLIQHCIHYIPFIGSQMARGATDEMKYVLGQLVGLNSPNSILKTAKVSACTLLPAVLM